MLSPRYLSCLVSAFVVDLAAAETVIIQAAYLLV